MNHVTTNSQEFTLLFKYKIKNYVDQLFSRLKLRQI